MEKTCGNCNNADFELMQCDYAEPDGSRLSITKNQPVCEDWLERALTDEEKVERYEALEDIAGRMWRELHDNSRSAYVEGFKKQLEDLGVIVDG